MLQTLIRTYVLVISDTVGSSGKEIHGAKSVSGFPWGAPNRKAQTSAREDFEPRFIIVAETPRRQHFLSLPPWTVAGQHARVAGFVPRRCSGMHRTFISGEKPEPTLCCEATQDPAITMSLRRSDKSLHYQQSCQSDKCTYDVRTCFMMTVGSASYWIDACRPSEHQAVHLIQRFTFVLASSVWAALPRHFG